MFYDRQTGVIQYIKFLSFKTIFVLNSNPFIKHKF